MIEQIRLAGGTSIEEAAHLSGMEISEWMAIEGGHVPSDPVRLRAMAAVLEIPLEQLTRMAAIGRGGWLG